jgi:hypothetical protein
MNSRGLLYSGAHLAGLAIQFRDGEPEHLVHAAGNAEVTLERDGLASSLPASSHDQAERRSNRPRLSLFARRVRPQSVCPRGRGASTNEASSPTGVRPWMRGRCSPKKSVAESSPRVRDPVFSKMFLR